MKKLSPLALKRFKELFSEKYTGEAADEYQREHGARGLAWALREQARKETQDKGRSCRLWFWQKKH